MPQQLPDDVKARLRPVGGAQPSPEVRARLQPVEDEGGFWSGVKDVFTGESRQTPETDEAFGLPEPESVDDVKKQAKVVAGLMSTMDPQRQMRILAEAYPGAVFDKDEKGNFIVDMRSIGGNRGALNPPGVDFRDLLRFGGMMAAFTPGGRVAAATTGAAKGSVVGAGTAAATQSGLDLVSQAAGGTEDVALSNIQPGEVAMAAAGGAGGELLARGLSKLAPLFRRTEEINAAPEVKRAVQQALREVDRVQKETGQRLSQEMIEDMLVRQGIPDDIAQQVMSGATARQAATASRETAEAQTKEFGIPYTAGQRTASPERLQMEEALRSGGLGGEQARAAERGFSQFQESAVTQAARRQQEAIGGGRRSVASVQEAGDIVSDAVKQAADDMNRAVSEAYEQVPKGAFLNIEGARQMTRRLRRALIGSDINKRLRSTSDIMDDLGKMDKALKVVEGKKGRIPLDTLEGFRRRLNGYIKSAENPTDQLQVLLVKRAFDDYMDTAVADKLLQGAGEEGYEALKNARALRREYSELFEPQVRKTKAGVRDNDTAGRLINKIAELDPETDELVNAMFGAGNLFGKRGGAEVVRRLKQVLEPNSPEFQSVREAAFLKLFGVDKGELAEQGIQISGRKALTNLREAMQGRGRGLANELFTKEELDSMIRLAQAIKRTQPERFNPSGTAGQLGFQLRNQINNLIGMAGFAGGPVQGIMATALQKGMGAVDEKAAVNLARQVFSGKPLTKVTGRLAPGVTGTAGGATAAQAGQQATSEAAPQVLRQPEPERR